MEIRSCRIGVEFKRADAPRATVEQIGLATHEGKDLGFPAGK